MRSMFIDIDFTLQNILVMIQDFSGIRSFQQIDAAKQRGLAASTGADNGNNLTLVTMKINVIQNLQRTKMLFQMLDFYDAIHILHTLSTGTL